MLKQFLKNYINAFFVFVTSPSTTRTVFVPDSDIVSFEGQDSLCSSNVARVKRLAWDGNLNQVPTVLTAFGIVTFGYR